MHVGLDKLRDTVLRVEDLRKSLAVKRTQLEAKDKDLALFELRRQSLAEQPKQGSAHAE